MFRQILNDKELSDKKKLACLKRLCKKIRKSLPLLCKLLQKQTLEPKNSRSFIKSCYFVMERSCSHKIAIDFAVILEKAISSDRLNSHVIYCVYELQKILIDEFRKSLYDINECKTLLDEVTFPYLVLLLDKKKAQHMPKVLYTRVKDLFFCMI